MSSRFEQPAWHRTVADLVAARKGKAVAVGLARAIAYVADHEGTCLIAFHKKSRPEVLYHTLEPAGRKHYLERYLDGPYLLDPLYQLALQQKKPGLVRFRDATPDRFRSSEYYRQYYERTHLRDEMDYVVPVSKETTVVLVIGRRTRMFGKAEVHRLQLIEPVVNACIKCIWDDRTSRANNKKSGTTVHNRLADCFKNFGQARLTRRERQISQLLLRGHSSKSIARELGIAPGTVMVHKRNLFAKLGISSQYELFSLFIDDLRGI